MFAGKTFWQVFGMGGTTMYVLLMCSVISIAVMINRLIDYMKKSKITRTDFMDKIIKELKEGSIEKAQETCRHAKAPFAKVVLAGLRLSGHNEKIISNAMEREVTIEVIKLEKYTSIVGTIGNTAVYIGLFGTVLGIIRAFHDISFIGAGGINVVIGGVAEALIATASGLAVAVPAVIAYNYFIKRIDNFVNDMELCASEILDLIAK
ncbi:MAG: MotA/TolQ/ExbB proton channel family protein [Elusimicrobiota bacterium]